MIIGRTSKGGTNMFWNAPGKLRWCIGNVSAISLMLWSHFRKRHRRYPWCYGLTKDKTSAMYRRYPWRYGLTKEKTSTMYRRYHWCYGLTKEKTSAMYRRYPWCYGPTKEKTSAMWKLVSFLDTCTVNSRYLKLGYLEFCEFEASIWIKNTFWFLPSTIIWRWGLFYKSKLPEVQINLHFG